MFISSIVSLVALSSLAVFFDSTGLIYNVIYGSYQISTAFLYDVFSLSPEGKCVARLTPDLVPIEAYETPAVIFLTEGYSFAEHKIITEDDYVLTAWRIQSY